MHTCRLILLIQTLALTALSSCLRSVHFLPKPYSEIVVLSRKLKGAKHVEGGHQFLNILNMRMSFNFSRMDETPKKEAAPEPEPVAESTNTRTRQSKVKKYTAPPRREIFTTPPRRERSQERSWERSQRRSHRVSGRNTSSDDSFIHFGDDYLNTVGFD